MGQIRMRRTAGRRTTRPVLAFVALIALSLPAVANAAEGSVPRLQAERLVHMLGYLDADYARFGRREHREHAALAAEAERIARELPAPDDVAARVAELGALIERGATAADVDERVVELRTAIVGAYRIEQAPAAAPSVAHGRELYELHCAACHGVTGRADTPAAAALFPRPASFRDPLFGDTLSPYDITTAIQFGVDGTAMVPVPALDEQARWDVALYVLGLRHPGPLAERVPTLTRSELATATDQQLRADLFAAGVGGASLEPTLAALRRQAPFDAPASGSSLTAARNDLDAARLAVGRGERDAARLAIRDAERRGLWPTEIALDNADRAALAAATNAFAHLDERVRSDAPAVEVDANIAATLGALTHAEYVLGRSYGHRGFASWVAWSALLLVRAGLLAALAIGALLGAMEDERSKAIRRAIHLGWGGAVVLGLAAGVGPTTMWAVPGPTHDEVLAVLWLVAGGALLRSLVRSGESRAWLAFCVAFAATCGGAFDAATSLASFAAVGLPTGGMVVGVGAGSIALVLVAIATTRARRRWLSAEHARVARAFAGGIAWGATTVALGVAVTQCDVRPSDAHAATMQASGWPQEPAESASAVTAATSDPSAQPLEPCSEPGFGPGPALQASADLLPFDVTNDCMFPGHSRLEIALALHETERPKRDQLDALLRNLFQQVRGAEGASMPDLTHICAFAAAAAVRKDPYGCLEFEADEGPQGELSVRLDLPFEPEEWARAFAASHSGGLAGSHTVQVTVDQAKHEIRVVYPYVDRGGDGASQHLDYADAAIRAFPILYDFYPPKTAYQAITFVGTWRGKPVLTVHVDDLKTFLSMSPWPIRERMAAAGIPLDPSAERTPEQTAALGREYTLALAKLPKGSIVVDASLDPAGRYQTVPPATPTDP